MPGHLELTMPKDPRDADTSARSNQSDSFCFHESGMRVSFQDVTYLVQNRANRKEKLAILKGVSGFCQPGELTAMMGPSGSGKTTTLDILAGRKTVGDIQGSILFAGQKAKSAFLKRHTGYVEQFDTLIAELTVREMLQYTAELKCPTSEPLHEKRHRVDELLEMLALQSCKDVFIGDALSRGISGGQAKRTNVGIALITSPRVLFLDEPTSGLDSFTAHEVISVVRTLCKRGITICATIHCPPPHTFKLFNAALIMQQGNVVYFGPNGAPCEDYFCAYEGVRRRGPDENLAEWVVEITSAAHKAHSDMFVEGYASSSLKQDNEQRLKRYVQIDTMESSLSEDTQQALKVKQGTTTPMWQAILIMLRYRTLNNYTNRYYMFGRLFDKTTFCFFTVVYYWHIGRDKSAANVPNIAGFAFMWVVLPAYGAGPYLPTIVLDRPIYIREMSDGLYTPLTYLTYKMIEECFMAACMTICFTLPTYFIVLPGGHFAVLFLTSLISLADGIAFAYATAAISPSMDIANALLLTVPTVLLFGSGYLLRWNDIPRYLLWLSYLDWMWYGWGALMITIFRGTDARGTDGSPILEYYSLGSDLMWAFVGYSALFFLFFVGLAWVALSFLRHQRR